MPLRPSNNNTDTNEPTSIDNQPQQVDLGYILTFLKNTFKFLSFDVSSRLRVIAEAVTTVGTVNSVTTVGTVNSVTSVAQASMSFGDLGKPASGQISVNMLAKPSLNNFVRS